MINNFLKNTLSALGYIAHKKSRFFEINSLKKNISHIDGGVIFDVGANVGAVSLAFSQIFPKKFIYAFEPASLTFEKLKKNVQSNTYIKPYQLAMGNTISEKVFFISENTELSSFNQTDESTRKEIVKISTVDAFCASNSIDFIYLLKTDTEGYDLEVLQGAKEMMSNKKIAYVLSEVGFFTEDMRHSRFLDIADFLKSQNFICVGFYNRQNLLGDYAFCDALFRRQ